MEEGEIFLNPKNQSVHGVLSDRLDGSMCRR